MPPSSKKVVRRSIAAAPRTSLQMPAIRSSVGPWAATTSFITIGTVCVGDGSALRSTFALGVCGRASMTTKEEGSMKLGSSAAR